MLNLGAWRKYAHDLVLLGLRIYIPMCLCLYVLMIAVSTGGNTIFARFGNVILWGTLFPVSKVSWAHYAVPDKEIK
ncbi:hypothetical protein ASPFODRAFT_439842 [Aspergillus luchuensis CBS 106.47]|uniref:Uncharacterized protein n=1 Tax=Aspergillus luchuensis (strain CBS 106.47) TaxID=1137211 RepID=A0A1M3TWA0_ASPLC|nr:hypothetical protein ASPFODRAFT_439842 [Aspergillus luchuensis CBS 106.47]